MSADANKAVFLSYASQDAEAAKRIAEALRAVGVEVWFDQNELVGGDAWDKKIRGQISSCALFVPVISAATQARREGYFRIEWKLAAQRTHAMADGTPFLLPVVIDATRDLEALVPAEFKAVQWTRLAGGEPTPGFLAQVKRLLEPPVKAATAVGRVSDPPSEYTSDGNAKAGHRPALPRTLRVPVWLGVIALIAVAGYWVWQSTRPAKSTASATPTPSAPNLLSPASSLPPAAAGAAADKSAPAGKPAPADKSVAVLAFANLSDDKGNEYFSDGISEELLNVLAKVPGLKVSARTSAFYFKGKEVPIPEIARQLGVAYVIEGSVRKVGDKVRITAQLIKAADGFHVWSDTFTRELKDVFGVQDEIAGLISQNLQLKLLLATKRPEVSAEAYGWLLQGRFVARQESNAARRQSIDFYRRAIGLAPGYALAWAEMAQSYIRLARFGGLATAEGMKEARLAAQKSLELDPDQPVALDAMGWVQRTADWDWRAAQKTFQRALALAPENSAILADAAVLYFNVGRVDEALALARQAAERDPLNAMAQIILGDLILHSRNPAEGIEPMEKGLKLAPDAEEFRARLAIGLARLRRFAEADATIEQEPNEAYRLWGRGIIAGLRGDHAAVTRAREALMARTDLSMTGYVANLFGMEGKIDEAYASLERSIRDRESSVCWIKTAVDHDPLKSDPRWPVFLRKVGLADDQLK